MSDASAVDAPLVLAPGMSRSKMARSLTVAMALYGSAGSATGALHPSAGSTSGTAATGAGRGALPSGASSPSASRSRWPLMARTLGLETSDGRVLPVPSPPGRSCGWGAGVWDAEYVAVPRSEPGNLEVMDNARTSALLLLVLVLSLLLVLLLLVPLLLLPPSLALVPSLHAAVLGLVRRARRWPSSPPRLLPAPRALGAWADAGVGPVREGFGAVSTSAD